MNSTTNIVLELNSNIVQRTPIQALFYALYNVIFVLGMFGNALVCYVVYANKAMQTVTNLFITNLALSDILLCVTVFFTPIYSITGEWVFGNAICHLVPYVQATSVYVSTLTLTAIAIDRYFVILHPLKQRMKMSTCICIIVAIWTCSMVVTVPYGMYIRSVVYINKKTSREHYACEEQWPVDKLGTVLGVFNLVMQYAVPFSVITFCYICISLRLNRRTKSKPGTKSARKEDIDRERKRRTNRMLIAMVSIFGVCWLPLNAINVTNDLIEGSIHEWHYFRLVFLVAHAIAMSSTCYNPFLYAWLNENFRKEFKQILPCCAGRANQRLSSDVEPTIDTLLPSGQCCMKSLQPREPIAEKIIQTGDHRSEAIMLNIMKEDVRSDSSSYEV